MNSFIENLNGRGETFLTFVWPMLWQSSLLITVLLAFDFLVRRKVRASVRYTLWLVVLLKLCLPPTLALPTSPAWWLHKTPAPVAAKPEIHYTVTYDTTPLPEMPAEPLPVYVPPKPSLTTAAWLLSASVLVSSGLLLWLLVRWWHITRLVRRAAASEKLTALAAEAQQIVGMNMKVRVKLTTNAVSPAVCGLFRPAILIPQSLAENFSDEQMRAVLLHELIHLRRRDVWMNFLQALLQIAYWWHPLVWLANARIRRVREEAVDDAVMLALNDGAEAYAPTLLEVAKLALNRPLVSLGLVGIMESRNALRQRIERLLDFHPPRQAGLTLVSLLGVLAFTAVAVPMGEGPVPAPVPTPAEAPAVVENADVAVSAATEEQSLTVTVDPEIFIRNVKAQAGGYLLAPTNDYSVILMEIMRSEGIDSNPPHGLVFNNKTGEITTQNTPENTEAFRRVIDQLNRADGKCELPLRSLTARRKMVLAEARIYQIRAADLGKFTAGLHAYDAGNGSDAWWSVEPGKVDELTGRVEAGGLQPIMRPRLQTASGGPAEFLVSDGSNGTELDCIPYVKDGFIDLTLRGQVISGVPTEAALTNQFYIKASAENHGGIVVRMENLGGHTESNLVMVINAEIITNRPPPQFQQRLKTIIKRADGPTQTAAVTTGTNVPQVLITAYFCEALAPDLKGFEKSLGFNVDATGQNLWVPLPANQFGPVYDQTKAPAFHRLSTPRVVTLSGEAARMSMGDGTNATDFDCTPVITNGQVNLTFDFRVVRAQAGVMVTNRFHTVEMLEDRGGLLVKSADAQGSLQSNVMVLARVEIITNASVRFQPRLQKIIKPAGGANAAEPAYTTQHQKIITQLKAIRLAEFMPFKEETLENVVQRLSQAIRQQDTNSEGVSFLITGPETSRPPRLDPATGLPVVPTNPPVDARLALVHLDTPMENLTVMDILDRVVMTAVPPVKYSIADFGVVFSARSPDEIAGLFTRTYKVDPRTFISALKTMGMEITETTNSSREISAAARKCFTNLGVNLDSPAGKAVFFNGGIGGNGLLFVKATEKDLVFIEKFIQTLQSAGGSPQDQNGPAVGIVSVQGLDTQKKMEDLAAADSTQRNAPHFQERLQTIINRVPDTNGDPAMLFTRTYRVDKNTFISSLKQMGLAGAATNSFTAISEMTRKYFTKMLGVNLDSPSGKVVFVNDGNKDGSLVLFVKATGTDLDAIEHGIQTLNQVPPQTHIKARFLEVPKGTLAGMKINTVSTNSTGAGLVGILSDANFRVALRSLSSRPDVETLGEPEVTTLSGRQCQMRATRIVTVITNATFQETGTNGTGDITYHTSEVETGPICDVTPSVLADGYAADLPMTAFNLEFWGYPSIPTNGVTPVTATNSVGQVINLPMFWPAMQMYRSSTHLTALDNQTVVLSLGNPEQVRFAAPDEKREAVIAKHIRDGQKKNGEKEILVFVTVTIIDPVGNRVHTDEEVSHFQESSHFQIKAAPDTFPAGRGGGTGGF